MTVEEIDKWKLDPTTAIMVVQNYGNWNMLIIGIPAILDENDFSQISDYTNQLIEEKKKRND